MHANKKKHLLFHNNQIYVLINFVLQLSLTFDESGKAMTEYDLRFIFGILLLGLIQ